MSDEFVDYVIELLGPFGTVRTRRMFGGYGVYLDGLMFAIVSGDTLYLKADRMNRIEFEQAGCEIFGYARKGKRASLDFFRTPEDAMESAELMLPWARTAYAAALRTNAIKLVAQQTRAAAKLARPASNARATKTGRKPPSKKTPLAKLAGKTASKKTSARPVKSVKRSTRTG